MNSRRIDETHMRNERENTKFTCFFAFLESRSSSWRQEHKGYRVGIIPRKDCEAAAS